MLPKPHLIALIARYSPLVELGAGTGYWTYLLRLAGADVVAYDLAPPGKGRENRYHPDVLPWTDVIEGDVDAVMAHSDRALFLCWPPRFSALWESLDLYRGNVVIYVGDRGPRTARLRRAEADFELVVAYPVLALDAQPGRTAQLYVWRRRRLTTGR
ncbi:MAG: hypothetical protein ACYDB4_19855 [Candidatus Dormibacteraceae bacterium]